MGDFLIPLILAVGGLVAAFTAYRDIKRGGARVYTLERETILRRASFTVFGSAFLFLAALGLLVYRQQQLTAEPETAVPAATSQSGNSTPLANTPTPGLEQFPPLATETPTPDPNLPTATPTRVICRGVIEGTFGNGLTLRDAPGGVQVAILAEADLVTLLEGESPVEANGFTWVRVRSLFGEEGWVATQFLKLSAGCEQ